jgi:hypothetical protein
MGHLTKKAQLAQLSKHSTILTIAAQVVQLTGCNLMTLFNPIWRVTIGGVPIPNRYFGQSDHPPAVEQTFMSKLKPDTPTLKLSTLFNPM